MLFDGSDPNLSEMYNRYTRESNGDFSEIVKRFKQSHPGANYKSLTVIEQRLKKCIEGKNPFIKVVGRPCTGKSALAANITKYISNACTYFIEYGLLSQNAECFEKFIFRELTFALEKNILIKRE